MFGYSLLRMGDQRGFFNALMDEMLAFGVPIEGLHTETGPGVYEAAIAFSGALEQADRAILFKTGAKEIGKRFGVMPSFMAKWSQQYPGCSGHIHQSLSDGKSNLFYDAKATRRMSKLFESYLAGQVACMMDFAPMIWPTINSYKRLVDGFWAPVKPTWGIDNRTASFRVIAGSPKATRLETRCPGADVNPYLAMAAVVAAGLHGVEKGLKLTAPPITGTNQGAEHIPRAPRSLIETARIFKESTIAREWLGDTFVEHFAATREWEWRQWQDGVTDWELKRYFEII
jgi:glutamine synthetase